MKIKPNISLAVIMVFLLSIAFNYTSQAQTEGFNVKTPIEKIAYSTSKFLTGIVDQSAKEPKKSIPKGMVCNSECFLVIPEIDIIQSRGDFTGTGLMACRTPNTDGFTEPLYYQIDNLNSFEEAGGGLVIFITDQPGKKAILGDDVHLSYDNTIAGPIGSVGDAKLKPFTAYAKYTDENLAGIDLSGSVLEYSSKDTFDAYQGTVVPVDIFVNPQDVPPVLRDFGSQLTEWTKYCK
jgi:lipid-binding SYLF domain-containing protein